MQCITSIILPFYSKKGKRTSDKILLPLQDSLINKAKACEEVILFERGDLRVSQSSQSVRMANIEKAKQKEFNSEDKQLVFDSHKKNISTPTDYELSNAQTTSAKKLNFNEEIAITN